MTISELLRWAIPFALGGIVTHLWVRYRRRLRPLRWSDTYQRIAGTAGHPAIGTLEVRFNGVTITNVHLATVLVQNDSSSDLENVTLNFALSQGTAILASLGQVRGNTRWLPFTEQFLAMAQGSDETSKQYVAGRRDYVVPVLNRDAIAVFEFLVSRTDALEPKVFLECDHAGVVLRHQKPAQSLWGIPRNRALVVGTVVGLVVVAALAQYVRRPLVVAFCSWSLGYLVLLVGIALLWLWRSLLRLLG